MLGEKQPYCQISPGSSEPRVRKSRMGPVQIKTYQRTRECTAPSDKFVKGSNNRESSVTLNMQDLKWDSLDRCREVSRLTLFYKAIHQETGIPFRNQLVHSLNNTTGHSKCTHSFVFQATVDTQLMLEIL